MALWFKIIYVSNGIEVIKPEPISKISDSSKLNLIFLGRLHQQKNLNILIEAINLLVKKDLKEISLKIYGDGPLEDKLADQIDSLQLKNNIKLKGYSSNIRERLLENDALIITSSIEGNSNAILESMEAGIPVLATDVGGASKQLGSEGANFLIKDQSAKEIANTIEFAYKNKELLASQGKKMRERVKNNFDINLIAMIYSDFYKKLFNEE